MMQIDSAILATDKVICKNISRFDDLERGLLSQNILSQLRNFVEYIASVGQAHRYVSRRFRYGTV